MPYRWHTEPRFGRLTLWPHRSLSPRGFAAFILATAGMIALPLLALLGTSLFWALLPFLAGTVALLWYFLRRSYADGGLCEELRLWPHRIELTRRNPGGAEQTWSADPHRVRVELHEKGGPVENYVTLTGGGREVEIGAFLSPDERVDLCADLNAMLARLRCPS